MRRRIPSPEPAGIRKTKQARVLSSFRGTGLFRQPQPHRSHRPLLPLTNMADLELRGIAVVLSPYLPQNSRPVMISPVSPGNSKVQFAAAGRRAVAARGNRPARERNQNLANCRTNRRSCSCSSSILLGDKRRPVVLSWTGPENTSHVAEFHRGPRLNAFAHSSICSTGEVANQYSIRFRSSWGNGDDTFTTNDS